MSNKAFLQGEDGGSLLIDELIREKNQVFASVIVKSDWYSATIKFESSSERIEEFLSNLHTILETRMLKETNFINENGNFEIGIKLGDRGEVEVQGILIKSMVDESRLEYGLESSYQCLSTFYKQLQTAYSQ
jgi:hypothetical protein